MEYIKFKTEINNLITERQTFHPNDEYRIYSYWGKISNMLITDETKTIKLLNESDKETIEWLSEIFEEISDKLNTEKILNTLNKLNSKFPDLKLNNFY